jgi:hypothetical protein
MKRALIYWFAFLLILVSTSFLFVGCKSKKPTITEETKTKDSSRYELHSDYRKEVNKKVADSIAKSLPLIKTGDKNCDSICNEKCDELLEQANFYKQSGDNNYKLYFDKEKRLMSFVANLQETISELKNKVEIKERYFVKTKIITITKKEKVPVNRFGFLDLMGVLFLLFLGWRFSKIFRP